MDPTTDPEAPVWAILELMGHRQLAGRIREVQRFGVTLCQIEMDRGPGEEPVVQFYGGAAIFGVTLTDEATVRRIQARGAQYAGPVQVPAWRPALPAPDEVTRSDAGEARGSNWAAYEADQTPDDDPRKGISNAAEPGATWCEDVDEHVAGKNEHPGPAPLDALAQFIREAGGLDEFPALALVDELRAARGAADPQPW